MKSLLRFITLSGLAGLMIAGCNKKNDSPAPTFQNLAGTYKLTALKAAQGSLTINLYDSLPSCQKDDLTTFNKDSTYVYVDAGAVCSPNGSNSDRWSVQGNIITVGSSSATIKSFTGNTLVVEATDASSPPVIYTSTYTRQ